MAIGIWVLASVGFGFYVSNFGRYNKPYGSVGGIIVFLLWLWLTNLALLVGAEIDAERERARELQAGIAGRATPPAAAARHQRLDKAAEKRAERVAEGRRLRLTGRRGGCGCRERVRGGA